MILIMIMTMTMAMTMIMTTIMIMIMNICWYYNVVKTHVRRCPMGDRTQALRYAYA